MQRSRHRGYRIHTLFCRCLLAWMLLAGLPVQAADPGITVFAASSLTDVLQSLGDRFTHAAGVPVRFSFAASSVLARQIENGAGADVFFSADQDWMNYLQAHDLIQTNTRRDIVGNHLVLIAPADSNVQLKIVAHFPLAATLGNAWLATGDPDSVPVGRYARAALTTLGVWNEISEKIVRADNVRSALAFVERGEVPFGIVYATDAAMDNKVRVVDVFPKETHAPITYPVAVTRSAQPQAIKFVEFLRGADAQAAFGKYGFESLR